MFNTSALLDNSSTDTAKYLQVLAHFILRYVMCIVNKEDFMNNVKVEQANAFSVNPELDKMNKFKCPLCLFTSIDVAAVWFQYVNHYEEWVFKKSSIAAQSKSKAYHCTSKFTSSKGGRKLGGSSINEDGVKLYNKVKKFVEELKGDCNYEVLQKIINVKAKGYGMLEDIKPPALDDDEDGSDDDDEFQKKQEVAVPVFDGWDSLQCSAMEGV